MKALFAHDHKFIVTGNDDIYSNGKVKSEMFDIYMNYFDSINIVSRFEIDDDLSTEALTSVNNEYISFSPFPDLSSLSQLLKYKKNLQNMCKIVKQVDFVIARLPSEIGLIAIDAAKKLSVPYAIEMVACPWDGLWNYGTIKGKLYAPYYFLRNKYAIKHASSVIYVTTSFLQERYPTNGLSAGVSDVDIDVNSKSIKRSSIKNSDCIKVGLIGSLDSPHKGIETAIRAIKRLNEQRHNVSLHLLGPGDKQRWIEMFHGELNNVYFDGALTSGAEVSKWLRGIDVYIQPSTQEGLPRAILEAMNEGCPVIGSTAGGIPELVRADFIHKKNDHNMLCELIKSALVDKTFSGLSEHSLVVAQRFKKENLLKRRMAFWKAAVSGGK